MASVKNKISGAVEAGQRDSESGVRSPSSFDRNAPLNIDISK